MSSIETSNIFLCDFYDSFTYNIYGDLTELGGDVFVFKHDDISTLKKIKNIKKKFIFILGPGPGHPLDYDLDLIHNIVDMNNSFTFGICLGHQIIGMKNGFKLKKSKKILHGQKVKVLDPDCLFFKKESFFGQRYNSLSLVDKKEWQEKLLDENDEVAMLMGRSFITCQFHLESIGSSCPNSIYKFVLKYLI